MATQSSTRRTFLLLLAMGISAVSGQADVCPEFARDTMPNCYRCVSATEAICVLCRNSQYLHEGSCYPDCNFPGYDPRGVGTFRRTCRRRCPDYQFDTTPHEDTPQCQNYTICDHGQVEAVGPTAASDRQCGPVTQCGDTSDCIYDGMERSYRGTQSITLSGRTCQAWSSQTPHTHTRNQTFYPNAGVSAVDLNYCRNPDGEQDGPWCYTTDPDRTWEHCNVCRQYTDASGNCQAITESCPPPSFEAVLPTWSSDRICGRNIINCTVNEYEIIPFTSSTDRVCTALTDCSLPAHFEAIPPTATTDRTCSRVSDPCSSIQFESSPPTTTSDRVCQTAQTTCPAGMETSVSPTPTSDRVCVTCSDGFYSNTSSTALCTPATTCESDAQYESQSSTTTTDAICTDLTICAWFEYAMILPTPTSDRAGCTSTQTCAVGFEERTAATTTSDRVCSPCTSGYFKASPGSRTNCILHTECGSDEFAQVAPTSSTDRTCAPVSPACNAQQFETSVPTETSDRLCEPITNCGTNEYLVTAATPTTNNVCQTYTPRCIVGETWELVPPTATSDRECGNVTQCIGYCSGRTLVRSGFNCQCGDSCHSCSSTTSCTVCRDGKFLHEGQCITSCPPHLEPFGSGRFNRRCCPASGCEPLESFEEQYEAVSPTEYSDRTCLPVSLQCPEGQFQTLGASLSSDITCSHGTPCTANEYESRPPQGTSDRTCESVTACDPGHYIATEATPTSDRQCSACTICNPQTQTITRACAGTNNTQCSGCSLCGEGDYVFQPCNLIRDTQCATCTRCIPGSTFVAFNCGFMQDTVCSQCATCGLNQYEIRACTEFRNTGCVNLSPPCAANEYEASAPTLTTDRECRTVRQCRSDEYLVAEATPTSDTVCEPISTCTFICSQQQSFYGSCSCGSGCISCTVSEREEISTCTRCVNSMMLLSDGTCASECPDGIAAINHPQFGMSCFNGTISTSALEFEITAPTQSSDRSCGVVRECPANQYETTSPTPTSNRLCTPHQDCTRDEYEAWPPSSTTDRICLPISPSCDFPRSFEATAATLTSDRRCELVRGPCDSDEYISAFETPISNRVCTPLVVCSNTQFESLAPTPTSDRICEHIDVCITTSEFESQMPTETSNRECTTLTQRCGPIGENFEAAAPTTTSDRICQPTTSCSSTQFESQSATEFSDRVCDPLTVCSPLEYEVTAATFSADRACAQLRVCSEDEFETASASATSNRVCGLIEDCIVGRTYESTQPTRTSNRVCLAVTECGNLEYELSAPTYTMDRVCDVVTSPCHPEFYEASPPSATSDRSCLAATQCTIDEYEVTPLGLSSDRECVDLSPSCNLQVTFESMAPTRTTDRICQNLTTCTQSQYTSRLPGLRNDRECSPVDDCISGSTFEVDAPTAVSNRQCSICSTCNATEWLEENCTITANTVCTRCSTSCPATTWKSSNCTSSSDIVCTACTVCSASQYRITDCGADSDSACVELTVCSDLEYESRVPTAISDRECSLRPTCPQGSYQTAAGTESSNWIPVCSNWSTCLSDQFEVDAPTAFDDRLCQNCTVCPFGEYAEAECTSFADTICKVESNCDNRCEISDGTCQDVPLPCSSYQTSSSCPAWCYFDDTLGSCTNPPDSVSEFSCLVFNSPQSCPRAQGCAWDISVSICRPQVCTDLYTADDCSAFGGCEYVAELFYCHPRGTEVPCSRRFSPSACTDIDDKCQYSNETRTCYSTSNCEELVGGADECNAVAGCEYDTEGRFCHSVTSATPCSRHTVFTCPTAGVEYALTVDNTPPVCRRISDCTTDIEYETEAPTNTSNRECAYLTICNETQFISIHHTSTTDRLCQEGRTCRSDQFESEPITATTDRECTDTTICTDVQFISVYPTATSDRQCQSLTQCDLSTEYYSPLETPTTDRGCEVISPLCPQQNSEFLQTRGPTPSSDRSCGQPAAIAIPGIIRASDRFGLNLSDSAFEELMDSTGHAWQAFADVLEEQIARRLEGATAVVRVVSAEVESNSNRRTRDSEATAILLNYIVLGSEGAVADINEYIIEFDEDGGIINGLRNYELGSVAAIFDQINLGPPICPSDQFLDMTVQNSGYFLPDCAVISPECVFLLADNETDDGSVDEFDLIVERYFEFESRPPSRTLDRICTEVNPICNQSASFEEYEPTPTSDRICTMLRICNSTEFQTAAPTYSTDRSCQHLTECDSDVSVEYASRIPTSTSDRVCSQTSLPCGDGFFQYAAPTTVSDRDCRSCEVKCGLELDGDESSNQFYLVGDCLEPAASNNTCVETTHCDPLLEFEITAWTYNSDRECDLLHICDSDEWESTSPTATTDRNCTIIRNCTESEYEFAAPTSTSNRVCSEISGDCPTGQFIGVSHTLTSDRVCFDVASPCLPATQWQVAAPTRTSDRVCAAVTQCVNGEFEEQARTLTSDRVCNDCSVCISSEFVSQTCTIASDTQCTECTECAAGTYPIVPCTANSDVSCATCRECGDGYFISTPCGVENTECSRCARCDDNSFVSTPCSESSNTVCETYTACESGAEYECTGPTDSSDRQCCAISTCSSVEFVSRNATDFSDTECATLTQCESFEWESIPPTIFSDRRCDLISQCVYSTHYRETIATTTSDTVCTSLTECTESEYQVFAPTTDTDRECRQHPICTQQQFESRSPSDTSPRRCSDLTNCTAFQYEINAPSLTTDRTCNAYTLCRPSEYESAPGTSTTDRECTALTQCTASQYQSQLPSDTSDRICSPITECNGASDEQLLVCEFCSFGQLTSSDCSNALVAYCTSFDSVALPNICSENSAVLAQSIIPWRNISCDLGEQFELSAPTPLQDRVCGRVSQCRNDQIEVASPTSTSDRICATPNSTTSMASLVVLSAETDAESSATPWWIIVVVIFGLVVAVGAVYMYVQRAGRSKKYTFDPNLPYAASQGQPNTFQQVSNMAYDTSLVHNATIDETEYIDQSERETDDPNDWLVGTVPLASESGTIRSVQARYLQDNLTNGHVAFASVPSDPYPPETKSGSGGGPLTDGASHVLQAHAVEFPTFPTPHRFVTCRQPDGSTIEAFWQLVWDREIDTLATITDHSRDRFDISNSKTVTLLKSTVGDGFIHRELNITAEGRGNRIVNQIEFTEWPTSASPNNPHSFAMFVESVSLTQASSVNATAPILITCGDVSGPSGVFMLVSIMGSKLKQGMVPKPQDILVHIRGQCHGLISAESDYFFALRAADALLLSLSPPKLGEY